MITDARFEAHLGPVVFRGGFGPEPGFYVSEVDGLLSGGEVTYDNIPLGSGPGVHDTEGRREDPRVITLRGLIIGESSYDLGRRIDQLGALLGEESARGVFTWVEFDDWRRVSVRRGAGWSIVRNRATGTATFVARFRAADQRIYGGPITTEWGGAVTVTNRGTYPAPVVVEVRGNKTGGYTIIGPRDRRAVIQLPISPGTVHRYEAETGLLTVNGAPQVVGVSRSDQIDIPNGQFAFSVDPGCELRVTFAPTWAP